MEEIIEKLFLFLMLLLTISVVDLKIKENLKEYYRVFRIYHAIVEINLGKWDCINCSCLCLPEVINGTPVKVCRCLE